MAEGASAHNYTVDDEHYDVHVPGIGHSPTMAYMSCNGYSAPDFKDQDRFRVWRALARRHDLQDGSANSSGNSDETLSGETQIKPYQLLLLGGDQVYADAMKEKVPTIQEWFRRSWKSANRSSFTAKMRQQLESFYFDLYVKEWSHPEVARIFARVPSIAMWDDHDLIDGWGSYPEERQNCRVFQGLWDCAAKAFAVFQQHVNENEKRSGAIGDHPADWWQIQLPDGAGQDQRDGAFSHGHVVGDVAIVAADLRSQRSHSGQIVKRSHWDKIFEWIDNEAGAAKHLLFMSSIPAIYPDFAMLETALGWLPGNQDLEDDLRDHWSSVPHRGERARLLNRLLALAKREQPIRATIVSGDVHIAALATLHSKRDRSAGQDTEIAQLISSGIVHPGPGGIVLFALKTLFNLDVVVDDNVTGEMQYFPGTQSSIAGKRNYLSIEPDLPEHGNRLWCNWIVEDQPYVYTKVIQPIVTNG